MSDSTHAVMQRAFELIENDALEQAQELLSPLLESDADNPALWWVYSHALRDPDIGRAALARVLELDPSYPGARELNADVLALQTRRNDILGSPPVDDGSAQAATDINIDDWEDLQPVVAEEPEPSRSRWGLLAASIVLLIFLLGVALVASGAVDLTDLLSGFLPTQEPAVIVVVEATTEATTEVTAEAPASGLATEASALPTVEAAENEPTALSTLGQNPKMTPL